MSGSGYLLGYDVGSSFVKGCLMEADSGRVVGSASAPDEEMMMAAPEPGWAEQDPALWWDQVVAVTHKLTGGAGIEKRGIASIGISYQMHGLVAVDEKQRPLRSSIIWCDSRAVPYGKRAFEEIGPERCLHHFLNSPGNFTASKLKWVQENEPEIYKKIHKIMLPGDYIAMMMTGRICTTVSGLSEAILWDYRTEALAGVLLDHYGISAELIPEAISSFEVQGGLTSAAAQQLGLESGIPVAYRAGDQPNNAFSLNVREPGEVAATAGTSGVIYGISERPVYDNRSRVNTFVHVNHAPEHSRYGVLLCVNGSGSLNSWLKRNLGSDRTPDYEQMNALAGKVPVGSDGLVMLPFGNGAERILEDADIGAQLHNLQFNRHRAAHLFRAAQEGVVFALHYGLTIMKEMGMSPETVKAGHANMFLSPVFREAFANLTETRLELYNTDGAQGAARGGGVGAGIYSRFEEAFSGLSRIEVVEPEPEKVRRYGEAYKTWLNRLRLQLRTSNQNDLTR